MNVFKAISMKEFVLPASAGSAGLSSPVWLPTLPDLWQWTIAGLGFLVLVMTAWGKYLDLKIKNNTLAEQNRKKPKDES